MTDKAILLSIRPRYADMIFEGSKTVELRRVRPRNIIKGDLVLLYVSSPIQSLAGAFQVEQVVERSVKTLWQLVKEKAGISRQEFDAYYQGASTGVAIFFQQVWQIPEPIVLDELRRSANFKPPQSFRYVTKNEMDFPGIARFLERIRFRQNRQKPLPLEG